MLHSATVFDNASAQPAPITSSGLNTQISGPISDGGQVQYDITGGTRAGTNLFHSFGEFGVPNHTIANFHNDSGLATSNILGRVTGGKESQIFGTIRTSEFSNANLFLMNPAGFLFGPNATLDVGGMATFTSADYLRLSEDGINNGYFYADPTRPSLLAAWPVAAFGFLGPNSASIAIQGRSLEVADGKTLSFVGGPRVFTDAGITVPSGVSMSAGSLSAPNGLIYMATVTSPGEVPVPTLSGSPLGMLDPPSSATATIRIRSGEFVMDRASLTVANTSDAAHSAIEVTVQGAMELKNGSSINTAASGTEIGGAITLKAEKSLALRGNSSITTSVENNHGGLVNLTAPSIELTEGSNIGTTATGSEKAGNVELQGDQVTFSSGSFITTRTQAGGHGGDITIRGLTGEGSRASDIRLSENSRLVSETIGDGESTQGNAGHIRVETTRLNLSGRSFFNTASRGSTGDAGNISVHATESVIISGSGTQLISESADSSSGDAGDITITAPSILVEKGGGISSNTGHIGDAGTITVNTNSLRLLTGGRITSSSLVESETPPSGTAGAVTVKGLTNSARSVLVDGFGSGIFTDTKGTGPGGAIDVSARTLTIQNGGTISAETSGTTSRATGGSIKVTATDHVTMTNGVSITARSTGPANAGNIEIDAGQQLIVHGSKITTEALQAKKGGDIKLVAIDRIHMANGEISTSVSGGTGSGGNITIDPNTVILQNSQILAKAVHGKGGDITITTQMLMPDSVSRINASAPFGLDGTVRIQSPYAPAGGKIQPLGNRPLQATSLLNQSCAAMAGGQFSSFTVAGRNSLPTEPSGWLSSPSAFAITKSHGDTMASLGLRVSSDKPREELPILSLRQIAPSGFLTKAFAAPRSPGCAS